jgi:hypothetical protein
MFMSFLKFLSRCLNWLTGGDFRETFSARIGREAEEGCFVAQLLERVINAIFFWDPGHCYNAWLNSPLYAGVRTLRFGDYVFVRGQAA